MFGVLPKRPFVLSGRCILEFNGFVALRCTAHLGAGRASHWDFCLVLQVLHSFHRCSFWGATPIAIGFPGKLKLVQTVLFSSGGILNSVDSVLDGGS